MTPTLTPPVPPLGFVPKRDRTAAQHTAAAQAESGMVAQQALPVPALAKGDKLVLGSLWADPAVVADLGFAFPRIHQDTGSCVWAGGTNALMLTICAQRLLPGGPVRAFLPFTLHNYALSRHYMGDDSRGEGSLGSTFAQSLRQDGVRDWPSGQQGLPTYQIDDGIQAGSATEMAWSSVRNPGVQTVLQTSKAHLLGNAALCKTSQDVKGLVLNGYGVSFACDNYIGQASLQGAGAEACVVGYWNGSGGHQQYVGAYWEHPSFGPLYGVGNNWPSSTYPADPGGLPACWCWVTEAHVDDALQRLDAEVYGLSHQDWFPAQPSLLSWIV